MWLACTCSFLLLLLSTLTDPLARLARSMWDESMRWQFDRQVHVADQEAARPLLPQKETTTTTTQDAAMSDDELPPLLTTGTEDEDDRNFSGVDPELEEEDDRNFSGVDPNLEEEGDPPSGTHESLHTTLSHHSSAQAIPHITTRSLESSHHDMQNLLTKFKKRRGRGGSNASKDTQDPKDQTEPETPPARPTPVADIVQSDYGEPFMTLSPRDNTTMEVILTPVRGSLQRLRDATPESLPKYDPRMKIRSHAQVLQARLKDVAEHIECFLDKKAEKGDFERGRGTLELQLW